MNKEDQILEILAQMQQDISGLKAGQANLEAGQAKLEAGQAKLEAGQAAMRADITDMRADIAEVKNRVLKLETAQENVVLPKLQLLAEGQTTIQRQIQNLSVVDRMQQDIDTLKAAVSYLSNELRALKEAM